MAKQVSACMFCGEQPCVCNAKPKAAPKPRASKPAATPAPVVTAEPSPVIDPWAEVPRKSGPFAGFVNPTQALVEAEGKPTQHAIEMKERATQEAVDKAKEVDEFNAALAVIRDSGILGGAEQIRIERIVPRKYPAEQVERINRLKGVIHGKA